MSEMPGHIMEEAQQIVRDTEAMPSEGNVNIVADALIAAEKRGEERERDRCAKIAENAKALPSSFYDGAEQNACLYGQEAAAGTIALAIRDS